VSTDRRAAIGQMIVSLLNEPMSNEQLQFVTASSEGTVGEWIKTFRAFGLVHVADWLPDARGYRTVPAYRFAPGQADMPSPAKSSTERVREYRKRQKGEA